MPRTSYTHWSTCYQKSLELWNQALLGPQCGPAVRCTYQGHGLFSNSWISSTSQMLPSWHGWNLKAKSRPESLQNLAVQCSCQRSIVKRRSLQPIHLGKFCLFTFKSLNKKEILGVWISNFLHIHMPAAKGVLSTCLMSDIQSSGFATLFRWPL